MIRSFKNKQAETVFNRGRARKLPPEIHKRAKRKLLLIDSASSLDDLKVPPGNRLEHFRENGKDNGVSALINNGASVLNGMKTMHIM